MRFTPGPRDATDRFEVFRFYNGISGESKEGLERGRTRVPLVKSFLLEYASNRSSQQLKPADRLFTQVGAELKHVDESFYSVTAEVTNGQTNRVVTGFLEQYDERFFAYYTHEDSVSAQKRVAKWAQNSDLDRTWFSSPLLQELWNKDVSSRGDHLFGKLVFKHESIFEMPDDSADATAEDEDDTESAEQGEDRREPERRKARFEMADRIGQIRRSLANLQNNYDPLNALYALRLPSCTGRGGHDLFQAGQITNRSNSFEDHRNTVRYLYRIYRQVLEQTEKSAWHDISKSTQTSRIIGTRGEPLIVKFSEPLSKPTFDRWVSMAFQKRNRFKIWGDPIVLGPTKVHVYGADRHLWQPINLEMTADGIVAVLPYGTCGNTFHRLVANIQHYVCPKIAAWIGSQPFEQVVGNWPARVEDTDEA